MAPTRTRGTPYVVSALLVVFLSLHAHAQTLEVSGAVGSALGPGTSVAILGMRAGDRTADVRFGVVRSPRNEWNSIVGARVARSTTLGLLGAATLELDAAWRTDGLGRAQIAGQGVLGPASLRVGVAVAGADPEAFSTTGLAPDADVPRVGRPSVTVKAQVRYRASRAVLIDVEPDLVFASNGLGLRMHGEVRIRRLVEPFDGLVAMHAWRSPRDGSLSGGLGLGAIWAPRRAPEWRATAWVGWQGGAVLPGIALRGAASLGGAFGVAVDLAAEPFRTDVPPYRGVAELTADFGAHEAFVSAQAHAGTGRDPAAALALGVRLALPDR